MSSEATGATRSVLDGVRVVDMSDDVAGAFGTRFFAAWGADVIKVEAPTGDPARHLKPRAEDSPDAGILFAYLNSGKRSVVADLSQPGDRERLVQLLRTADIVVESAAPGELAATGIDLEALRREKPSLVVCSVTPYGKTGPQASWRATSLTSFASGGQMSVCGDEWEPPLKTAGHQAGYQGGLHVFAACTSALLAATRTGQGDSLDISLQEVQAACLEGYGPAALVRGSEAARTSNQLRAIWGIYPCADGHVGVASMARQTGSVWRLIGHPELVDQPAFRNLQIDPEMNSVAELLIGEWTAARTAQQIFEEAGEHRAPFSLIAKPRDLLEAPGLIAAGFWREVDHPVLGKHLQPGMPFEMSGACDEIRRAPLLGEHTEEVFADLKAGTPPGATLAANAAPKPIFDGIRVLDLSQVWAGPYCARFLSDMGADVIHIEGPAFPDAVRSAAAPGQDRQFDRSAYFNDYNRNKRGLALELHDPAGLAAFRAMVANADVVLENWSVGVSDRLGIGYKDLAAINPRVVFAQMPAYGNDGPDAARVGFGPAIEQMGGLVALQGYEDGPPHKSGISYGDPNAGITSAGAIALALFNRERTGVGAHLVLRQRDNMIGMVGEYMVAESLGVEVPVRIGNRDLDCVPHGVYQCADEGGRPQRDIIGNDIREVTDAWVTIAVDSDEAWATLRAVVGDNRLDNPSFDTVEGRRAAERHIDLVLGEWCEGKAAADVTIALQAAGVAASPVLSPLMLTRDGHLAAREYVQAYNHPLTGECATFAPVWRLADRPLGEIRPAPMFGQHNREVLAEIAGLDSAAIDELEQRGIIATVPTA